ncbi:hypothetical protein BJ170DRAFT_681597 [Xylariales sp. AK1849]|nr:hypothetical protein BJ170DRAFT_681597 [Xylariales sp. AK1849]
MTPTKWWVHFRGSSALLSFDAGLSFSVFGFMPDSIQIAIHLSNSLSLVPELSVADITTNAMSVLRSPTLTNILGLANLSALGAMTIYFKSHHDNNLEQHEARMDELEGTLRGHIGLIEDSLERLEGGKPSQGASEKADKLYTTRGKDEK